MLKIVLCIVIVLSCGGLGIIKAQAFSGRYKDLNDLKNMIKILETEMSYKKDPLPNAFKRISEYKENRAMELLQIASQYMAERLEFSLCWDRAIAEVYDRSDLTNEDVMILKDMGLQLGKSDIQGQAAMFSLVNVKLDDQIKEADQAKKTKGKMYKSLGFSIGAVIAIILI